MSSLTRIVKIAFGGLAGMLLKIPDVAKSWSILGVRGTDLL